MAGSIRQGKENGATVVNHVHVSERNCVSVKSKIIILVSLGLSTEKPSTPPPTVAPGVAAGCGNSSNHQKFIKMVNLDNHQIAERRREQQRSSTASRRR